MNWSMPTSVTNVHTVLSTDKEISGRKEMDAHAQYFMVNNVMLPPILKTFALCTRSRQSKRLIFAVCV
jgi:hypothetical protein